MTKRPEASPPKDFASSTASLTAAPRGVSCVRTSLSASRMMFRSTTAIWSKGQAVALLLMSESSRPESRMTVATRRWAKP